MQKCFKRKKMVRKCEQLGDNSIVGRYTLVCVHPLIIFRMLSSAGTVLKSSTKIQTKELAKKQTKQKPGNMFRCDKYTNHLKLV